MADISKEIKIDRSSGTLAYKQLMEQIIRLIRNGRFKPGDPLPSERELTTACGMARGTIKKAYERLAANGVIEVIHGRGSFVSYRQDVIAEGRKEKAIQLIRDLLVRLEEMKFSPREISTMVELLIMEREERQENLFVAVVDCNSDCLDLYERQIGLASRLQVAKFLLNDVLNVGDPMRKLAPFELIVTSATHYTQLLGRAPKLKDRIVPMILSLSQEAVMNLAQIKPSQRIGIWCRSEEFLEIIRRRLKEFSLTAAQVASTVSEEIPDLHELLKEVDVLIVPPAGLPVQDRSAAAAMDAFGDRGGRVIKFDYQIERGSLAHVEDRLRELMRKRPSPMA